MIVALAVYLSFPGLSHRQGSHPLRRKKKSAHLDLYGSVASRKPVESVCLNINTQLEHDTRLCTLVLASFVFGLPDMATDLVGAETMRFVDVTDHTLSLDIQNRNVFI